MLNNKAVYLPALAGSFITPRRYLHKNGKGFKFYVEDEAPFYYPDFLISAGSNMNKPFLATHKYDITKGIRLGDSGGYQLATGVIKYTPEIVDKILNWLEDNTNYAMNIDFPPTLKNIMPDFKERLDISVKNYAYFMEHKKNKTKLMNVLHGYDLKRLNMWYDRTKDFYFEGGWGIGSIKDGNIYYALLNFFFLYEKGEIDRYSGQKALIHFLGFSRVKEIPILLYVQHLLNKQEKDVTITFDSSYPLYTATFGHVFFAVTDRGFKNYNLSSSLIKDGHKFNGSFDLPCNCPICKGVTLNDVLENFEEGKESSLFYMYIGAHNLYKMIEYIDSMFNLISYDCEEISKDFFSTEIIDIFKVVEKAFNSDSPTRVLMENKFKFSVTTSDHTMLKKSLFDIKT